MTVQENAVPGAAAPARGDETTGSPLRLIPTLLIDVGLPIGTYYVLHALGASDFTALLAATLVAGVRVLVEVVRHRRLEPFAAFLMIVFGVGLALSFVTGDARFLLLKDSFGTSVAGLLFLGSCLVGRPLTFHAAKRMSASRPGAAARMDALWAGSRPFRHVFVVMSLVWGFGLIAEALARVPLVYLLPVSTAVGASGVLQLVAYALLIGWTVVYSRRRQAEARASGLFADVPDGTTPTEAS